MNVIVVYESHWGNTAAVARAIAEGMGPETRVLSTAEATGESLAGVDLLVAGALERAKARGAELAQAMAGEG